jgi:ADP-heptose:LPS heptosyltransferase
MQDFREKGNERRNIDWKAREYFKVFFKHMPNIENVIEK